MKRELVEDNERTYGQEVRERWGDAAADGANRKMLNLSKGQFARFQELGRRINEELEDAVRAGADLLIAHAAVAPNRCIRFSPGGTVS